MKTLTLFSIVIIFYCNRVNSHNLPKKIDALIEKVVSIYLCNSSVLSSKNRDILYEKVYGIRDAAKQVLNTSNTIYQIVSHRGNILGFSGYFDRVKEDDVSVNIHNNIYCHQIITMGLSIFAILYDKPYSYFDELKLNSTELDKYIGYWCCAQ